jgi:ATP-dependent helicase/nuclease subunit A
MDKEAAPFDLTPDQLRAIQAEGNVLVVAGAGTGKTRTLVERCLARVLRERDPVSLDQVLMVTFTEAAAAQMRQRIREGLEERIAKEPGNAWLAEQLALLDTARISTLHSFCLYLVREHFYELQLDPQFGVLDEAQAQVLALDVMTDVLRHHYEGATPNAGAVQELILTQGMGGDEPIRRLVFKLHRYARTLRDPDRWFSEQLGAFREPDVAKWESWLLEYFSRFSAQWLPALRASENEKLRRCVAVFEGLPPSPTRTQVEAALAELREIDQDWPRGTAGRFRKPYSDFFDEVSFLDSLSRSRPNTARAEVKAPDRSISDPLFEDWRWICPQMTALLELTMEFGQRFAEAKRDQGMVDFHDLEQFALTLLWDRQVDRPTPLADYWRRRLRLIFVDEYQDINAAQDRIIEALSGEGPMANRFMVGDIKQSIYRFRLANLRIFQSYRERWERDARLGSVIPLRDNFRSHEGILDFVNSVFALLLHRDIGGVEYDETECLTFAAAERRRALSVAQDPDPPVELHLCLSLTETGEVDAEKPAGPVPQPNLAEITDAEREAWLIARRLRVLHEQGYLVWDERGENQRPATWRDMVVLLRSPVNKAELYAKEFERAGVPLQAARGGFYEATEISDLINLLMLLDNPLQDLPALAVLRSPLVGLAVDELAAVRLAQRPGRFWLALQRFHARGPRAESEVLSAATASAWRKVDEFLGAFTRWRSLSRQAPLAQCLETVLEETHYVEWLRMQPRGEQRCANVERLLRLTRQSGQLQRQGLFRFLKFVQAQQEAGLDVEPAPLPAVDAVRLMSIHQSKGLEFPIVVVADLGKTFNFADLHGPVILDEEYGLCAQVKPPQTEQRYPSLSYWLAQRRQRSEILGEEMRLLYVAMTRAGQKLILTGTVTDNDLAVRWAAALEPGLGTRQSSAARSHLDWLGMWFVRATGRPDWPSSGRTSSLEWKVHKRDDIGLAGAGEDREQDHVHVRSAALPDDTELEALTIKLVWRYPHADATREPAKASVSALRHRAIEIVDEEALPAPFVQMSVGSFQTTPRATGTRWAGARVVSGREPLSSAEIGTAHHLFQQFVDLSQVGSLAGLREEANRLELAGILSAVEKDHLDYTALYAYWSSELGRRLRAHAEAVHRELPFTARFTLWELAELGVARPTLECPEEFVVVQGVVDVVVLRPSEVWLADYKTDRITASELADKVRQYTPQLRLYALALERIYHRPVTECWLYFLALGRVVSVVQCAPDAGRRYG